MRQKIIGVVFVALLAFLPLTAGAETGKSPDDPIPAGEPGTIGPYTVTITGWNDDATGIFEKASPDMVAKDLPEGSRYILIDVDLVYNGDDIGQGRNVFWDFIGPEKAALSKTYCPTIPNDLIENEPERVDIFPGGKVHYQVCAIVPDDSVSTLQPYVSVNGHGRMFMAFPREGTATPSASPQATPTR